MRGGYLRIGRFRGAPIRVHVSLPLGVLFFSRFAFRPGAWVGVVALILVHELGHALLCRLYRLPVVRIDLTGLGGECHYRARATPWQRSVVSWGGVLAQALLLGAALPAGHLDFVAASPFARDLVSTFATTNLSLMALNLLPIAPLDGAEAWRLIPMAFRRVRRPRPRPAVAPKPRPLQPLSAETEQELRAVLERARIGSKKR
jgi:membrane-associated protease RseP (regulator of RpoE activity)